MAFFTDILSLAELKTTYRQLVMAYHPDHGGNNEIMKKINYEYARNLRLFESKPKSLQELKVGQSVIVNDSRSIVIEVSKDYFKARSIISKREAYFSKTTGFALLNFHLKARV
jgi:hypothetical protein